MTDKRCTKCDEWKLFSAFGKSQKSKDGHRSECKACRKVFYETNKEHILEQQRKYDERTRDRRLKYYTDNRDRILKNKQVYDQINKEKVTEYRLQYYQDNREYFLDHAKEDRKNNPARRRAEEAKRRARKKSNTTNDPWELQQIAMFYSECPEGCHVDHIIPLNLGGAHELSNLQHLEDWMNRSKHAKHPDDWNDPRAISCRA